MVAASFYTLFYWLVFGALCVFVMVAAERERQRRVRVRRMRERRERRRVLDQLEPKPWTR